jgi:hypothetical protein
MINEINTSSGEMFKQSLDKAFSQIPLNQSTLGDHMKYKQGFKEEKLEDSSNQNDKEMVDGIIEIIKQIKDTSNRKEVAQNMVKKLKREKVDFDSIDFLKKCSFKQSKKSEPKEATGSGSSGAYVGPVFSETENSEFWEKSRSETPKLEESEVEKVEAKEATTSGSIGGYESPSMWAKSTKKKDWGPSRKTQYKGGSFVKIKKKCMTFPYCNQGDIKNLKLSKNESVKEAIKNVASKFSIGENVIITILEHEYQLKNKSNK